MNVNELIDTFRQGTLDLDCPKIVLTQLKPGGAVFEGLGYIRQDESGALEYKVYVNNYSNVEPFGHFNDQLSAPLGKLREDKAFYGLEATDLRGRMWKAGRLMPRVHWNMTDNTALIQGALQAIRSDDERAVGNPRIRLHFFEEYQVPLHLMSRSEERGSEYMVRDRAQFQALGANFEVRVREGSGDTVFEVDRLFEFPASFHLRVQEALQYITGKTAIWRARLERRDGLLAIELASPTRKAQHTQLKAPISPASMEFHSHGWVLFQRYLAYVVSETKDTYWNPVAYHLYNACETSGSSFDASAVGLTVAAEAVASTIDPPGDQLNARRVRLLQARMRKLLGQQEDLTDVAGRMEGLIHSMGNRRAQDVMHALATRGRVEPSYVKAWSQLRNRHVHPTIKDLRKPDAAYYQKLFDALGRVEVLLRQLTFHLIGYEGPFSDYGAENYPMRQYPLATGAAFKSTARDRRL